MTLAGASELLGLDPLYIACEGRFVAFVPEDRAQKLHQATGIDRRCNRVQSVALPATVSRASARRMSRRGTHRHETCISRWTLSHRDRQISDTQERIMSPHSLVPRFLVVAVTLTTAGVAFARQPPALVHLQKESADVLASCPHSAAEPGNGYRNMLARFRSENAPSVAEPALVASRKMVNHLMISCAGGEIHQAGGYRDVFVRSFHEPAKPQIACANR